MLRPVTFMDNSFMFKQIQAPDDPILRDSGNILKELDFIEHHAASTSRRSSRPPQSAASFGLEAIGQPEQLVSKK